MTEFSDLKGKTLSKIVVVKGQKEDDRIVFHCETGESYLMRHHQSCCESVCIEDICGNLDNLLNHPILIAEERSGTVEIGDSDFDDSIEGWTFYEIATVQGAVTIRWNGESNGYYSVSVDFELVDGDEDDS